MLESSCLSILWPLIEPELPDAYARSREFTAGPFGCWRFGYKPEPVPTIDLHFANAFAPDSPFSPRNGPLAIGSLKNLLDQACSEHPQARAGWSSD